MRAAAWGVVIVTAMLSGGWAIPLGFSLGLSGVEIYLAANVGSMTGLVVGLFAGDRVRQALARRRPLPSFDPESRMGRLLERHGAKGLGLVGPVFPGVLPSVLIGLATGLPRRSLLIWMTVGIAGLFAIYTAGLSLLIEFIGLD